MESKSRGGRLGSVTVLCCGALVVLGLVPQSSIACPAPQEDPPVAELPADTAEETADDEGAEPKSRADEFNEKAEEFFKKYPVPLYYYATNTGHVVGLAKYNLFRLSKKDELSTDSKVEGILTATSEGGFALGGGATLNWDQDRMMYRGEIGLQEFPEYIFGIGNTVSIDDREEITTTHITVNNHMLRRVGKTVLVGGVFAYSNYTDIEKEEGSFLDSEEIIGRDGGVSTGLGLTLVHDSRDNRYNASRGSFAHLSATFYSESLGGDFDYEDYRLDLRAYTRTWKDQVCAFQLYTSLKNGDVPFYALSMLGGPHRMRGYYEGALRDNAIVDGQVEYRAPIWKRFGMVGFVGAGRVAEDYSAMSSDDIYLTYGFGLRFIVDQEKRTNIRIDFGFGPGYGPENAEIRAVYFRFAEAF